MIGPRTPLAILVAALLTGAGAPGVEGDVVMLRAGPGTGVPPAVFPHWIHRIRYRCYACHEEPFKMTRGANPVTMEAIGEGKYCGVCHDGKTAWASSFETCNRCHVAR